MGSASVNRRDRVAHPVRIITQNVIMVSFIDSVCPNTDFIGQSFPVYAIDDQRIHADAQQKSKSFGSDNDLDAGQFGIQAVEVDAETGGPGRIGCRDFTQSIGHNQIIDEQMPAQIER